MDLFVYAVLGLSATWLVYLAYMTVATRAAEGRPAAPLYKLFPELEQREQPCLVYCFSPHCGPCRPMSRDVDALIAAGLPLFKFDISTDPPVSQALGVRATPTLILINRGTVARMVLGVRDTDAMRKLLEQPEQA